MRMGSWWRLLREGQFQIHPLKYAMTFLGSGCSVFNSIAAALQSASMHRKIMSTGLIEPPVFIIGHWRSGTTLMHELFSLDNSWASPDNYDAFAPHHVLVSGWMLKRLVKLLLPGQRPMDSMSLKADAPQEDDFALISLGAPTPYYDVAFCGQRRSPSPLLALDLADEKIQNQTRESLDYFFRVLTRLYRRRLVLKSPPHTGRIALLAKWFPGAKFVHMSRDPMSLVPSTMKLWRALDATQGLQLQRYDDHQLVSYINSASQSLYEAYFRQRPEVEDSQLCEVAFEDLIARPVETVAGTFDHLGLELPAGLSDAVASYFGQKKTRPGSQPVRDQEIRRGIEAHWQPYLQAFGYARAGAVTSRC